MLVSARKCLETSYTFHTMSFSWEWSVQGIKLEQLSCRFCYACLDWIKVIIAGGHGLLHLWVNLSLPSKYLQEAQSLNLMCTLWLWMCEWLALFAGCLLALWKIVDPHLHSEFTELLCHFVLQLMTGQSSPGSRNPRPPIDLLQTLICWA